MYEWLDVCEETEWGWWAWVVLLFLFVFFVAAGSHV